MKEVPDMSYAVKVDKNPVLVKVMKDGSKKFRSDACPRCGGAGLVPYWTDNGRCWKCGGSGYAPHEWVEPSELRLEKQKAKAKLKRIEEADNHNEYFLKSIGFNSNGKSYLPLGNTYDVKEELKAMGAKFNYVMGWCLPEDTDKYPTIEVDIDEVANKDKCGWLSFKDSVEITDVIKTKKEEYEKAHRDPNAHVSEYLGNVGDKIVVEGNLISRYEFTTSFSYYGETSYIYRFEDMFGNVVVWKSGKIIDKDEGDECTIVGFVKEHKEYKGVKETVLTRCKVK